MNHPRARRVAIVLLAGLILITAPAFGQGVINPFGQPPLIIGSQPSYFIWVDQGGWHVRWSTPALQAFSGVITSSSQISWICPAEVRSPSWLTLTDRQAVFGLTAVPGIGGFDFLTTGSTVTFNLNVNTAQIPGWLVFIGRSAVQRSLRSFTLSAPPTFLQNTCREPHLSDVDRPIKDR